MAPLGFERSCIRPRHSRVIRIHADCDATVVSLLEKASTVPLQSLPPGQHLPEHQGHRVWWCETGMREGASVLVIHGGPGGRTRVAPFNWFDGLPVRCIAFDQRGCGQSTPAAGLEHNTLPHLVQDIERLRTELGIEAWGLVAGSWGALVAVAYAAAHPQRVRGMFLRSAFLGSDGELARFFEPWAEWLGEAGTAWLGAGAATGPLSASARPGAKLGAAWQAFEQAQGRAGGLRAVPGARFRPAASEISPAIAPALACAHSPGSSPATSPGPSSAEPIDRLPDSLAVQLHYLQHHCFVPPGELERWLGVLDAAIADRPLALVHGLADQVCHFSTTAALARRWPRATLHQVADAGHDMDAPALRDALAAAAREWAPRLVQPGLFQRSLR
jgi:proline iminopeptidase